MEIYRGKQIRWPVRLLMVKRALSGRIVFFKHIAKFWFQRPVAVGFELAGILAVVAAR